MLIFGGMVLLLVGILMLIFPDVVYEITQTWKSSSSAGPSDLYRLHLRIGGIVCSVVGVAGIAVYVLL